jgi:hypothetical protein
MPGQYIIGIGMMIADDEAPGKLNDFASPAYGQSAKAFVARAKHDLWPNSYVGGIVTDREFLTQFSLLNLKIIFQSNVNALFQGQGLFIRIPLGIRKVSGNEKCN